MAHEPDEQAELRRRFQSLLAGADMADLRQVAEDLAHFAETGEEPTSAIDLRRAPLAQLQTLRTRVDLDDDEGSPLWRTLDLRSDLTLDVVHHVLQAAFGWTDSHLHRFSLGGGPFDRAAQLFLCPFDVEEGDEGVPDSEVRLDEILQEPGDVLAYVYDYGDDWRLTLRLEEVRPAAPDAPSATAVAGGGALRPENSRGLPIAEDPGFDVEEANRSLRTPYLALVEFGLYADLVGLVDRLAYSPVGDALVRRVLRLHDAPVTPDDDALRVALQAHLWFLDRADGDGLPLTSAGYLKPQDVAAAARVVPAMADWIGKNNRESLAAPLLDFRHSLMSLRLLRKYKGTLRVTRAGAAARRDPALLWRTLAAGLVPDTAGFQRDATQLLLVYAATGPGEPIPVDEITDALDHLGWHHRDGRPLQGYEVYRLPAWDVLVNVSPVEADSPRRGRGDRPTDPKAALLAHTALRG